jgi:hypothetical protein
VNTLRIVTTLGFVAAVAASCPAAGPDPVVEKAVLAFQERGGRVVRADTLPGKPVTVVDLHRVGVADADLAPLAAMTDLEVLDLTQYHRLAECLDEGAEGHREDAFQLTDDDERAWAGRQSLAVLPIAQGAAADVHTDVGEPALQGIQGQPADPDRLAKHQGKPLAGPHVRHETSPTGGRSPGTTERAPGPARGVTLAHRRPPVCRACGHHTPRATGRARAHA